MVVFLMASGIPLILQSNAAIPATSATSFSSGTILHVNVHDFPIPKIEQFSNVSAASARPNSILHLSS